MTPQNRWVIAAAGVEHVGSIYGLMLTAWGVAGILGPTLMAALRERSGGYDDGLRLIAGLMPVSAVIPLLVRPPATTTRWRRWGPDR